MNVQFLYDNGRTAVINVAKSILPFNGLDQFLTERQVRWLLSADLFFTSISVDAKWYFLFAFQLKLNSSRGHIKLSKSIKSKYRTTSCRSWNLAIQEASVLKCIEISERISIYKSILLPFVKSTNLSISKRIKAEVIGGKIKMETDQSIESGYSSFVSSSILSTRDLLLDVFAEQIDKNAETANYLESIGRSIPKMEPTDFCKFNDENLTSINQLADQMRQQTVVENGLLNALCDLFQEMCNVEPAPMKRKRAESTTSSIEDDKESVRTVLKTITETEVKLNESEPKKIKTESEIIKAANKLSEERHNEYLACDLKIHDDKYLFTNVPKSLVCQYCLEPNDLTGCSGNCDGVYHSKCLKLIPTAKHYRSILMGKPLISKDQSTADNECDNKCARCTSGHYHLCIFCKEGFKDHIPLCDGDDCFNVFHEKCLASWQMLRDIEQSQQLCPAHNCRSCKSQIGGRLMKCLLCPAKYHQSASCIPAGCHLLSDYQMICVDHYTDDRCESNNNIKPLYGDFVWAKLG